MKGIKPNDTGSVLRWILLEYQKLKQKDDTYDQNLDSGVANAAITIEAITTQGVNAATSAKLLGRGDVQCHQLIANMEGS